MVKKFIGSFCVFGNPICHTKSPYIHELFSKQTGIFYKYGSQLVPLEEFNNYMISFFLNKGVGANITVPFKEKAYFISNTLTERARISRSVNTLKKIENNNLLGDNTDGVGILYDLKRINFIKSKYCNILVIGAGGASRGIIFSLLSHGYNITILNRTIGNAINLVNCYKNLGSISIFRDDSISNYSFDIIINTTVNTCKNSNLEKIKTLINKTTFCYDINYSSNNEFTPFLIWCMERGAVCVSDGIGMLVSQAAYSFYLWHGILPEVNPIIHILTKFK